MAGYWIDLIFVADDVIDPRVLLNENLLLESYGRAVDGYLALESVTYDSVDHAVAVLAFLFGAKLPASEILVESDKELIDLSNYKANCLGFDELERRYVSWTEATKIDNTMDEYGLLGSVVGHVQRNQGKKQLVVVMERRLPS
jgi:hypothetical protein